MPKQPDWLKDLQSEWKKPTKDQGGALAKARRRVQRLREQERRLP